MDRRLEGIPVDDLAEYLGFPSREVYFRPRFPSSDPMAFTMWSVRDVAGFSIELERLGFTVDATPMVGSLAGDVDAAALMTRSELGIHTYAAKKGRVQVQLESEKIADGEPTENTWRNAEGYRYREFKRGDQVVELIVKGPKYRPPRQETVRCALCKSSYIRGDREESSNHRAYHAGVARLVLPRALKSMRERLKQGRATAERVDVRAPMWLHREVYERAMRFKRDFGYDWPQWHEANHRDDIAPKWTGFVFTDDTGAIDGACAFALEPEGWTLCWVWIRPACRRQGLLAARWPAFLKEFGDFWIEHPLSAEMTRFVERHASPEQRRQISERYPDGCEIAYPKDTAV